MGDHPGPMGDHPGPMGESLAPRRGPIGDQSAPRPLRNEVEFTLKKAGMVVRRRAVSMRFWVHIGTPAACNTRMNGVIVGVRLLALRPSVARARGISRRKFVAALRAESSWAMRGAASSATCANKDLIPGFLKTLVALIPGAMGKLVGQLIITATEAWFSKQSPK